MLSGFISTVEMLDVNIYDSYYVFSLHDLNMSICVVFGLVGLGYWIMTKSNRKLSKSLIKVHTMLSLGGIR